MFNTSAEVKVKNNKNEVIANQTYTKVVFDGLSEDDKGKSIGGTPEQLLGDAIAFFQKDVGEKGNGVLELLKQATYAFDLKVRQNIRQGLVTGIAGPDKAIEKAIKDLMVARAALGKPITEDQARQRVMAE